jgi:hypothetical protein
MFSISHLFFHRQPHEDQHHSMDSNSHRAMEAKPHLESINSSAPQGPNLTGTDSDCDNSPIIPYEVIQKIFDYFPRQDLVAVAKTNHVIQRIVESMIQSDIREITHFIKKDPEYQGWTITNCSDLANLSSLSINSAGITEIPRSIYLLKNLQVLELINNKISELPQEMKNLKQLILLNLDRNRFTSYPLVLGEIDSLREVHMSGNQTPRTLPKDYKHINFITNVR